MFHILITSCPRDGGWKDVCYAYAQGKIYFVDPLTPWPCCHLRTFNWLGWWGRGVGGLYSITRRISFSGSQASREGDCNRMSRSRNCTRRASEIIWRKAQEWKWGVFFFFLLILLRTNWHIPLTWIYTLNFRIYHTSVLTIVIILLWGWFLIWI